MDHDSGFYAAMLVLDVIIRILILLAAIVWLFVMPFVIGGIYGQAKKQTALMQRLLSVFSQR